MPAARTAARLVARTAAATVTAALVAGSLAACTPADEPLLAVGRDTDGRPVAHLYLCGDRHAAHNATLYLNPWPPPTPSAATPSGTATPSAAVTASSGSGRVAMGDLWSIWNSTGIGNLWAIPMGTTPDGWRDEFDPPRPLALTATGRYVLGTWTGAPQPRPVFFTLADLDRLKDGEVWGYPGRRGDAQVITLKAFRDKAADSC
ncbi:hypothetical protein AB0J72_07645 [Dactylosporangium sp. NPDC049742]|uniref:hypothetical protein n=1 Tax=Dactylosporangium sp. NPDC049742 TaxID=3154737 RepID=UPI00342D80F6